MPAQKPSPHRFIAPNPLSTQTPKPKPKSSLRHAISASTPKADSELNFKKITPAKRFVVAPPQRHAGDVTPRAPDRVEEPDSSASTDYTPRPKAQRKLERVESIEEASQSSPARPTEEELDVLQTIEQESMFVDEAEDEAPTLQDDDDDDEEILFPSAPRPKRRRSSSPTPHHPKQPEPPTTPLSLPPHRFRFPAQTPFTTTPSVSTSTPLTTAPSTSTRPPFLLPPPPTSPQAPSRPLPELFSPSRKTHKYLPHGLASTVQTWIIEAASQTHIGSKMKTKTKPESKTEEPVDAREKTKEREREQGTDIRLRVHILHLPGGEEEKDCFPGGVVMARGQTEAGMYNASRAVGAAEGEGVGLLLAGQGGRGAAGIKVRVGSVVGVRAPTWDVLVGGEKWVVGVDWVVL